MESGRQGQCEFCGNEENEFSCTLLEISNPQIGHAGIDLFSLSQAYFSVCCAKFLSRVCIGIIIWFETLPSGWDNSAVVSITLKHERGTGENSPVGSVEERV